jgi:Cu-Zn family superoxide dismutase
MPNAQVLQSGLLYVEVYNPSVTLSGGNAPLLDADGSALIIHEKADDYRSQPSGEAGDRIACAVISR